MSNAIENRVNVNWNRNDHVIKFEATNKCNMRMNDVGGKRDEINANGT